MIILNMNGSAPLVHEGKTPKAASVPLSFLHERSVFIPSFARKGVFIEKSTPKRAFFMEQDTGVEPA